MYYLYYHIYHGIVWLTRFTSLHLVSLGFKHFVSVVWTEYVI